MLIPPDNFGLVEPGLYRCSKIELNNFAFLETLGLRSILLLDAENPPRPLKTFIQDNQIDLINLGGLKVTNHNHTGVNNNNANNREDDDKNSLNEPSVRQGSLSSGSSQNSRSSSLHGSRSNSRNNSASASPVISSPQQVAAKEFNFQLINLNNTTKKNDQWMLIEKNLIKKAFEIIFNKSKYNILIVDSSSTLVSILRKIQKWNFNSIINEFRIYNGNSAKSNYFAENFLELIDVELISFELDQVNNFMKIQQQQQEKGKYPDSVSKSPEMYRTTSWNPPNSQPTSHKNSIDDENGWEGYSKEMIDDDDFDDELLSASPQIPESLLKMVEKKRNNLLEMSDDDKSITPGTSPRYVAGTTGNSPMNNDSLIISARHYWEKRRPSLDAKIMKPIYNTMFRNSFSNSFQLPSSISNRSSYENINALLNSRRLSRTERKSIKPEDAFDIDEKKIKEKYEYKYYKNMSKNFINFDNVGYIRLKLPPTNKLPDWFIKGRDFWEESYKKFNACS